MEIPRGRGVLKANILEAKYEATCKLKIPGGGGGGVQNKNPSVGGESGYFLELHITSYDADITAITFQNFKIYQLRKGQCPQTLIFGNSNMDFYR